jgi:hypothetical protein
MNPVSSGKGARAVADVGQGTIIATVLIDAPIERVFAARYASAPRPGSPGRHFLLRLLPPRPTFAQDMRPDEMQVMQQHVEYWQEQLRRGIVIAFGPVADPNGGWGVGIVEVGGPEELAALQEGDPAIKSRIGLRYEALPMARLMLRADA